MASVLVVEDDPVIRACLIDALAGCGHVVRSAADGFGGLREVTQAYFDAVVLDLGLPDLDGRDALRMLRGISQVPVLVATARDDEAEIVRLLNAGADDYLVKPFSGAQLQARLAAVLRRSHRPAPPAAAPGPYPPGGYAAGPYPAAAGPYPAAPGGYAPAAAVRGGAGGGPPLSVGDLRIDPQARTAVLGDGELDLTRREFDLLVYLARRPGAVVSKHELLCEVWREPYVDERTVHVHLSALRRKLGESATAPRYLLTVRGVGIKLVVPR